MELLHTLDHIPVGLLELPASRLHEQLPRPTLITLAGEKEQPLFISVLLHGNEDTGWDALRSWLQEHQEQVLPRSLVIFIGNIAAAKHGLRRLDGQMDFNRIWKGGNSTEETMAAEVAKQVAAMRPFAAIDLHNNTGTNPHYACTNRLETNFIHLALLFSRTIIYFTTPDSVLSNAIAGICPAITVEAGKPGEAGGEDHCYNLIDAVIRLHHFPEHEPAEHDYDIFQTMAIARVADDIDFGIKPEKHALQFREDLDRLNFSELPVGTELGAFAGERMPLSVTSETGEEIADKYFKVENGKLITAATLMPSMLTLNCRIIRQDCLCYLMQRFAPDSKL